jgi:hypothetical protein
MNELENASQMPKIFYCKHMQPGIAKYENETILVDVDGMKNLIASVGKSKTIPIYINHQDVNLKDIKEEAAGYISDSFYNELDGWAWFKMIIVGDEGLSAIKKGWSVSNAYIPTEWGNGGTKIACPYNREVRNGEFTHLAIVNDPRYEGACIMSPDEFKTYQENNRKKLDELKNSKEKPMFKFFKSSREEVKNMADANEVEINGKTYTMEEMVNALEGDAKRKTKKHIVNGVEMTEEEIANAFDLMQKKNKKMKKNGEGEEPATDKGEDGDSEWKEEGDDEIGEDKNNKKKTKKNKKMKKNADDEEDDCYDNDGNFDKDEAAIMERNKQKKNSADSDDSEIREVEVDDKYFTEMRNAHLTRTAPKSGTSNIRLLSDGIKRGKERYGSKDGRGRIKQA